MAAKHLLVATDFSKPSRRALELAKRLSSDTGAAVDVLHIHVDPYAGYRNMPKESLWATEKQFEAYLIGLRSMLEGEVKEVFGADAGRVGTHIERGLAADKVATTAKKVGADLVCVGTTGKGAVERVLMGSVAQKIVRNCPVPVLTVH